MRKLFGLLAACCFVFVGASFAQDAAAPAPATEVAAPAATEVAAPAATEVAATEFTGVIEVTPADVANNETAATIVLDMGEKAYKLVVDAAKVAELEAANGKTVTVKGSVVAAGEGSLMDTLNVTEWAVVEAPADETAAPDAE